MGNVVETCCVKTQPEVTKKQSTCKTVTSMPKVNLMSKSVDHKRIQRSFKRPQSIKTSPGFRTEKDSNNG
jgi:hypothetical protein